MGVSGHIRRESAKHPSCSEEIGNALEHAWGPVLCSVLFSLALAVPDPSHEALTSVIENTWRDTAGMVAAGATLVMFLFLPAILHSAARHALHTPRHFGPHCRLVEPIILAWVGRLPLIAAIAALVHILAGQDDITTFARGAILVVLPVLLFFVLTGLHVFGQGRWRDGWTGRLLAPLWGLYRRVEALGERYHVAVCVAAAVLLLVIGIHPPIAAWLGPITVAALFVAVAAMALAGLTRMSSRFSYGRIPLILAVVGLGVAATGRTGSAVFLAAMLIYGLACFIHPGKASRGERGLALVLLLTAAAISFWAFRNHRVCPSLAGCNLIAGVAAPAPQEFRSSFTAWQAARPPDQANTPIHFIAAEGGGLFAAYYTAMYLAKRSDAEGEDFARSVFAISGVSGGSVGAAAFWAIRHSGICAVPDAAPDCHQQKVREMLARDYLSPVLARLFTWDLLDTVLPVSSLDATWRLERATQLERELIRHAGPSGSGLAQGLASSWTPPAQVPALFLNATRVESGNRIIQSPFAAAQSPFYPDLPLRIEPDGGGDITVATGAFISARFPGVTAPARILVDGGVRQFVDGGYFDNSGIETIHDLLRRLPDDAPWRNIRVIMLTTLKNAEPYRPCATVAPPGPLDEPYRPCAPDRMQGPLGAPVTTFLGAWHSRMQMSRHRAADYWDTTRRQLNSDQAVPIVQYLLPLNGHNYTVSWYLNQNTFCGIEKDLNDLLLEGYRQRKLSHRPEALNGEGPRCQ